MSAITKRFGEVQIGNLDLFRLLQPFMQQQLQTAMGYEPGRQLALQSALNLSDPSMMRNLDQQYRLQQMGMAGDAGRRLAAQLQGDGASSSSQLGALLQARNNAVQQSNAYSMQNRSLPGLMTLAQQRLGLYDQAMTPAMLTAYNQFGQNVYTRPYQFGEKKKGGGLLGAVGGALGGFLGAGGSIPGISGSTLGAIGGFLGGL